MLKRLGLCLLLLVAAVTPALSDARAADAKPTKFLMNYALFGRHAPLFLGIKKGWYKEAGFDLSIVPTTGSGFVNTAIDASQGDYGLTDASLLVKTIAGGSKVQAFSAFLDVSPNGLASLKPIPTPESLYDKTIAAAVTDSSRTVLPIVFAQKNLDFTKVKWQAADPGTYFSLLLSGQVDVIAAAMDADRPALTAAAKSQGKQAYFGAFGDWGYDSYGLFIITQQSRIAQHPEEVKAFLAATKKSVEYSFAHPEEAAKAMAEANSAMKPDLILEQWKASIIAMQTPFVKQHGWGAVTTERLEHTIKIARGSLNIDKDVPPSQLFADSFLSK